MTHSCNDVNTSFNNFLNIYLRIFQNSFPIRRRNEAKPAKPWLTRGIMISCINKRELYLTTRCCKELSKKLYYKRYCKVLNEVINQAKKNYYNEFISNSANKNKATWNIINENIYKKQKNHKQDIPSININGCISRDNRRIANTFNDYFLSVANKVGDTSSKLCTTNSTLISDKKDIKITT